MPKGFGTAKIRFGELYSEENQQSILISAFQSAGFRTEVNSQLNNGFGRDRANIVRGFVADAISLIKDQLKTGLDQSGGIQSFGSSAAGASYSYSFEDLAESTIKKKRGRLGADSFWLDWGEDRKGRKALMNSMNSVHNPKVTHDTRLVGLDLRHGPDRIDFEINIEIKKMISPLDDLVRRPLMTGEVSEAYSTGDNGKLNVLAFLDFGTKSGRGKSKGMPARPWINEMSATIGNLMFEELITNK